MYKKIISILLFVLVTILSVLPTAVSATEVQEHLLTIICRSQLENEKLGEDDVINLMLYCLTDGKSYSFDIYGYNNFTDKFMMPEGEYMVTEISIKERGDIILFNHTSKFTIKDSTTLDVPITNSGILITNPINDNETTAFTLEETTYYDPFTPSKPTEPNTTLPTIDPNDEPDNPSSTQNSSSENTDVDYTTSPTPSTTESSTDEEPNEPGSGQNIVVFIIVIALFIGVIAVVVIMKKRNSAD